jgi:hypothetical protein
MNIPKEEFENVEFTPSEENPARCKHCGKTFGEHFVTKVKCHESTTRLMTKKQYKELEEAKYDDPCKEAKQVIAEADEESILKLKIKLNNGLQVLEAFEIKNREDMVEAMKKNPSKETTEE